MPRKKGKPREILKKKLRTKSIYHYVDFENDIDVKTREVFVANVEIHYPINTRDGSQKYKFVSSIVFDGISPNVIHGVYKRWNRGWGFTRYLSPIVDFLEKYPGIRKIVISAKNNSKLRRFEIIFSAADIERIYQRIKPFRDQQSQELKALTQDLFAGLFPQKIQKKPTSYHAGQLARLIETRSAKPEQLSQNDIQVIGDLITSISPEHIFVKKGKFIATKEKFDIVSIEAMLRKFKVLLKRKNDSKKLEDAWHNFFREHSWILSQMFAVPMVIFEDKAYLGGKDIHNEQGKITDFIYKNKFTKGAAIIEIKTHKTPLLNRTAYRKPDVFSISRHLSGAVSQVLDQKDTYQKDYNSVTKGKEVESFNPNCIVLVGQLVDMKKTCYKSFDLFRNNSKDVAVVTFDELLNRIETILAIFRRAPKTKKAKATGSR